MSLPFQLEPLEHVRRRPGMYIGNPDETGLSRCVSELLANSLEQHLSGRCSSVVVTIHEDSSLSVSDDGPGIPTVLDPRHNAPFIELAFTTLNYTYKGKPETQFPVIGLAGVGAKCVNAVSEWMRVDTCGDNGCFRIAFTRGKLSEPLHKIEASGRTRGTSIRFKPDREIFGQKSFDRNALANMLQPLAVLHPGFDVWLVDERPNAKTRPLVWQYYYPNGIADFLKTADLGYFRTPDNPIVLTREAHGIKCALGFQFAESASALTQSFVNSSPTRMGGTHLDGFLLGLTEALNKVLGQRRPFKPHELRTGLFAVVGVWLPAPHYGGATRDKLINAEAGAFIQELTREGVEPWIADSAQSAERVVDFLDEQRRHHYT